MSAQSVALDLAFLRIDAPAVIGRHRATCPVCSARRVKSSERCLSIEITETGVRGFCHHCQWELQQ